MGHVSKVQWKYMVWLGVLVFLMAGVYFYTHRQVSGKRAAPLRPAVEVVSMARRDMLRKVVLSGETVPRASVDISPKYAGRIERVLVDLGDSVRAGDVLVTQDTRDLSISIAENSAGSEEASAEAVTSRAEYDAGTMKAQTDYDNALLTYERYERLFGQGAVSRQARDDTYRAMMSARASLEALRNQAMVAGPAAVVGKEAAARKAASHVEALEIQRADMSLVSPIDGVIGYREAEAGEWAAAGTKLLTVVDNSSLYLDVPVAEQDVGVLREGMSFDVAIDSLGESVKGRLVYISPAMDSATHSYKVRLVLEKEDKALRGGMFGRTEVTALLRPDALFLPKEAVVDGNGKKYVFVLDGESRARRTEVELGLANDEEVEIRRGVQAGDQVIVSHISKLKDGMSVEVVGG